MIKKTKNNDDPYLGALIFYQTKSFLVNQKFM